MAKRAQRRVIKMDRFKEQVREIVGVDELLPIQIGPNEDDCVYIRLGFNIDESEDFEDFMSRLRDAAPGREMAIVVLGEHPDFSGEEQLEKYEAAGFSTDELAMVFASETRAAEERLGKFRYRG